MEVIDITLVVSLAIELVEESSAGSKALADIVGRKLEKEQVPAVEFNLMMPITVNSTAKAIGGRILVEVGSLAMAVHTVPMRMPITAKAIHYWDPVASVYHTARNSSLKIPCS